MRIRSHAVLKAQSSDDQVSVRRRVPLRAPVPLRRPLLGVRGGAFASRLPFRSCAWLSPRRVVELARRCLQSGGPVLVRDGSRLAPERALSRHAFLQLLLGEHHGPLFAGRHARRRPHAHASSRRRRRRNRSNTVTHARVSPSSPSSAARQQPHGSRGGASTFTVHERVRVGPRRTAARGCHSGLHKKSEPSLLQRRRVQQAGPLIEAAAADPRAQTCRT